ncbi:hypothetical protein ACFLTH_05660 [Bacteroidota bacterium]
MSLDMVKDESVRKLAETLRANGLAASDTEAIRMAEEMSSTAKKIQRSYDEQDEKPEVKPTSTSEVVSRVENEKQHFDSDDSDLTPTTANIDSDKIFEEQKEQLDSSYGSEIDTSKTVDELMDEDAEQVYSESADVPDDEPVQSEQQFNAEPETQEVSIEQEPSVEPDPAYEPEDQEEYVIEQEPEATTRKNTFSESQQESTHESESQEDDGYEVDKTVEIPVEEKSEEERKKEADKMAESKVDLNDVFNFGKR